MAEVNVKFVGDARQLTQTIDKIKRDSSGLGGPSSGFSKATGALRGMALPALGAAAGIYKLATDAGDAADRLLDLEQITGVSTDKLQEMEHVAKVAGTEAEFYANSVNEVVKAMDRIERGTGPAAEALAKLDIATQNADGSMRSAQAITDDVIRSLIGMEDASTRAALAEDIFKRKAQELIPVLAMGEEGIDAAREAAHELGIVQSGEALQSANDFRIAMEELQTKLQAVSLEMLQELLPVIEEYLIPAVMWMTDVLVKSKEGWEALFDLFKGEIGNLPKVKKGIEGVNVELKGMERAGSDAASGARAAADGVRMLSDEVRKAADPAFRLRDAQEKMATASAKVDEMRLAGETSSEEYVSALVDEQNAMADLNYATEQYEDAGSTAAKALDTLARQAGQTADEIDLVREAIERLNATPIYVSDYRNPYEDPSSVYGPAPGPGGGQSPQTMQPQVTVHVAGSVTTQQELVTAVRNGMIELSRAGYQTSGF